MLKVEGDPLQPEAPNPDDTIKGSTAVRIFLGCESFLQSEVGCT
jgi:hypothetical protein